ncbi:MAG TPA: DUF4215 domain-containing protein [Candidatus Binatia bacterium]|nr:DUF4215 domain-containing protein [Candidatus Binatia bacterium]
MHRTWIGLRVALLTMAVVGVVASTSRSATCVPNGVRTGAEQCDGSDVGGYRCTDFCYGGGTLGCRSDCTFDFAGCCQCGNNTVEETCGETCDGAPPDGRSCIGEGFSEGGNLTCRNTCDAIDTNGCFRCGNGIKEGPETCDGSDFGPAGNACTGPWPEHGGTLSCTPGALPTPQWAQGACHVDRASCFTCGDGTIEPGEGCDDGNLLGNDGCSPTCQSECGNGVVSRTEGCDDGNVTNGDGCSSVCSSEVGYFGGNGEGWDECSLRWGVEAPVVSGAQGAVSQQSGGVTVTCRDGATTGANACDRGTTANQCTFLVFYCLKNLSLGGTCSSSPIARVALLSGTTLDAAGQTGVLTSVGNAMQAIGNAASVSNVTPGAGELAAIAPNVAVNTTGGVAPMCGALSIVVPRPGTTSATRVLGMKATDNRTPPRDDSDQITFVCQQP